jgi:hypothetical protein
MTETRMGILQDLADAIGGTIESAAMLPDGSGCATLSMPLPKDHWLTADQDGFNVPPMPFLMGEGHPDRRDFEQALRAAGRYAVRCATMNGKEEDFDPDALIQNLVVGMLGYHTPNGLSSDEWANPSIEGRAMATNPVPAVHRSVHYFDREEIVNAVQQKRRPEPFAAIITRVHNDPDGNPTNHVSLAVFDPEIGYQVKHDVPMGEDYHAPQADRWYFTPYQTSLKAHPAGAEHQTATDALTRSGEIPPQPPGGHEESSTQAEGDKA